VVFTTTLAPGHTAVLADPNNGLQLVKRYSTPLMRPYFAADVSDTIKLTEVMIKIGLETCFFQILIVPQHRRLCGIYYNGRAYLLTRLPVGHPLAPPIMQRFSQDIAWMHNRRFKLSIVACLDKFLIFGYKF
jgi:hypothetical protein